MGGNVQTLALAWYFTGDERYASRAALQLRAWFLDSATAMTPNLRFSQLVRGNPKERGSGIIDTRWFIEAADGARLLQGSRSWTSADDTALQKWFAQYVSWLKTSPNGEHEHEAKNNHGSWYAAQVASLAIVHPETARRPGHSPKRERRESGGRSSLTATNPSSLRAPARCTTAASTSRRCRAWPRSGARSGSTSGTTRRLKAEACGSRSTISHTSRLIQSWTGTQIDEAPTELFVIHLRRGDVAFPGAPYLSTLRSLPRDEARRDRSALLYPDPAR